MKAWGRWRGVLAAWLVCAALAGCRTYGTTVLERPTDEQPAGTEADSWAQWDRTGTWELRNAIGYYFASRLYDFLDIFDVSLSAGRWARIEAQYAVGFYGFGAEDLQRFRLGRRSFLLNEESTTICTLPFPLSLIFAPSLAFSENRPLATIATLGGISDEVEVAQWPDPVAAGIPQTRETVRITGIERDVQDHRFRVTGDSFPVGVEAHLLLGGRVRLYPLQLLDFLAGLFLWDPAGDDVKPYRPRVR